MAERKKLIDRMRNGEFVVSVQIDPPNPDVSVEDFKAVIGKLKKAGVRLVDINSSRRISHDSIHLAGELSKIGFETIPHVTTRDSSINGLLNQILAAHRWDGINNFLVITGDPYEIKEAVVPSQGVFQTDAVDALRHFGKHLKKEAGLDIAFAAAINQNTDDIHSETGRLWNKQLAHADFFMSQPVFSEGQAKKLLELYGDYALPPKPPLIVGIWPLPSFAKADQIKSGKFPGVAMPAEVFEEACKYRDDKDAFWAWSLNQAKAVAEFVRETKRAQGLYLVAPFRDPLRITELFKKLKK